MVKYKQQSQWNFAQSEASCIRKGVCEAAMKRVVYKSVSTGSIEPETKNRAMIEGENAVLLLKGVMSKYDGL